MPRKSGCSPLPTRRPPRSAWWSGVDKDTRDCLAHPAPASGSGMRHGGSTVVELASPRANGQCHHHSTPNGHCVTGNTLPGDMSRGTSDHVIGGDAETGCAVTDVDTPGCFACIALCHSKDSRKSNRKTASNQRRVNSRSAQMTSPANNNIRHIDVSDVIAADFQRLPDGHVTPAQGQVKVMVGNGSVGQRDSKRLASDGVRRSVDDVINEVADCPLDVAPRAAELTLLMSCDSHGCGRHDDGYSACDDRVPRSWSRDSFVLPTSTSAADCSGGRHDNESRTAARSSVGVQSPRQGCVPPTSTWSTSCGGVCCADDNHSVIVRPSVTSRYTLCSRVCPADNDFYETEMSNSRPSLPATPGGRANCVRSDDEHHLIARYVETLSSANGPQTEIGCWSNDKHQLSCDERRQLVAELEAKNRAILREIQWLRLQQQSSASPCSSGDHAPSHQMVPSSQSAQQLVLGPPASSQPTPGHLVDELRLLRRRRDELECRMVSLQSSRRQLMSQLDTLMSVLKSRSTTPSSRSRSPALDYVLGGRTAHLAAVSADVMQAFAGVGSTTAGVGSLGLGVGSASLSRPSAGVLAALPTSPCLGVSRDLLEATDFITGAVTSLVKELHTDDPMESGDDTELPATKKDGESATSTVHGEQFLAELRQHRLFRSAASPSRDWSPDVPRDRHSSRAVDAQKQKLPTSHVALTTSDVNDAYTETDQESYMRTDDEECGNTDWEETCQRWINR